MKLSETKITVGGVLRCCMDILHQDKLNSEVAIGAIHHCPHCKEEFQLQESGVWVPTWQLPTEEL